MALSILVQTIQTANYRDEHKDWLLVHEKWSIQALIQILNNKHMIGDTHTNVFTLYSSSDTHSLCWTESGMRSGCCFFTVSSLCKLTFNWRWPKAFWFTFVGILLWVHQNWFHNLLFLALRLWRSVVWLYEVVAISAYIIICVLFGSLTGFSASWKTLTMIKSSEVESSQSQLK